MPATMAETSDEKGAASSRGQKLWAVLLVVDAFFVIIFGGALAAKLYQHWQAPAVVVPPRQPRRVAKKAEPAPAPAPEAAKPAAPAPEPAKPAPAKPAETAAAPANGPRPPKPSLLHEAPQREKAGLQGSAPAAAPAAPAAPAAAPAGKAVPTEFSLKAPGAKSVELAGAFIVHGGKKAMVSHPDGTWTLTIYLTPNTYRYWFLVNGKRQLDPQNPKVDRNASVLSVGK